jgi:hypothetical protein
MAEQALEVTLVLELAVLAVVLSGAMAELAVILVKL